ncbi:MAG: hypothetical protein ABI696_18180 [Rubrivivax sp.]
MSAGDHATLLAGATGLVGRAVGAQWAGPAALHRLVRRAPASPAAPHQQDHVVDFSALPPLPAAHDACCCLGTTIKVAGSKGAFRAVDFDAVLAFGRAARAAGVARFAVVSALGADPGSRSFYNRIKGEMEAALIGLGFESLVIARPSLLTGDRDGLGQADRPAERFAVSLTAPLAGLIPLAWRPIAADTLARALLQALDTAAPGVTVLESAALQELGKRQAPREDAAAS